MKTKYLFPIIATLSLTGTLSATPVDTFEYLKDSDKMPTAIWWDNSKTGSQLFSDESCSTAIGWTTITGATATAPSADSKVIFARKQGLGDNTGLAVNLLAGKTYSVYALDLIGSQAKPNFTTLVGSDSTTLSIGKSGVTDSETVLQMVNSTGGYASNGYFGGLNLNVYGNVSVQDSMGFGYSIYSKTSNALNNLNISGNISYVIKGGGMDDKQSQLSFEVKNTAIVGGFIDCTETSTTYTPVVSLQNGTSLNVGGIKGPVQIYATGGSVTFTNSENCTISDFVSKNDYKSGISETSTTKIIMNGTASQVFEATNLKFTGGLEIKSGTMLMNYADVSGVNHGDLTLAKSAGAESAVFGASGGVDASAGFAFKDLLVSETGGTIQVRLSLDGENLIYDTINFSGSAKLLASETKGNVTISFADDGSDALNSYISMLVRDADSEKSTWTKIISWTSAADENINFSADNWTDENGDEYTFQTFNDANGLYVAYVAVPEPSTYAVIFGVLALGFAIYRRRK